MSAAPSNDIAPAAAAEPAAGGCPPDRTFGRLIEGTLADGQVRRLQAHCDACARCSRTLAELARTIAPDQDDWLGGRYRLLEPLGAGGMGVVFTAFDTKLQRKVAVKRLHETAGGASAERRARFLREARLLASLSHPNVLTVHDVGGIDRELYVVMELVDGWPMSQWVSEAEPRPGWRRIVDLYLGVGRGLSAAHQLDVVHRDIKPENILVARSGRVLIGDFGLAGLTESGEGAAGLPRVSSSLTETGAILGTPAYMAPELQDGKSSDALSDQFSFCVSLYESLHGRRPFTGQTTAELAAAARGGRLPLGRDGVPRPVDRVLATGLAADPRGRYPSMDDLLAELARAATQAQARARWPRPRLLGAGLMAAIVCAGAAATTLRPRKAEPRAPETAAAPGPPVAMEAVAQPARPREIRAAPVIVASLEPKPASRREPGARGGDGAPHARRSAEIGAETETDPRMLLFLADGAHSERDGAACLAALNRVPADAWPAGLAERALRRRATCEMLRGNCDKGRRLLEPLDGPDGARASELGDCPAASLATTEDRLLAVAEQADEARYAGNQPARRRDLRQVLLQQTASREVQSCLRNPAASRACGRRLSVLARAYQVVAESFLAGGDCLEGALLDVMQNQVKLQTLEPEESDPALRCRAQRTADVYESCAAAAQEAERRCVARLQALRRDAAAAVPDPAR